MRRWLENLEQFAIDVILGRRHGPRAALLRGLLYALSFVYAWLVQVRLFCYRKRILRERALGCLVISIGNLTVGGTGKTPIVEKFARALQAGGRRVWWSETVIIMARLSASKVIVRVRSVPRAPDPTVCCSLSRATSASRPSSAIANETRSSRSPGGGSSRV